MSELNIYQRINAIMKDCEYLQKEQAQLGKGIKYDTVIAMLRDLLIKHGVVMVVRQIDMQCISDVEGTKQKVYQGRYEMDLVNIDNPSDIVTHSVFAHGMDGGDKAPGKAHTYAVKIMLVKGFFIETGEDEESRAEKLDKANLISENQYDTLAIFCLENDCWTKMGWKLSKAYKIDLLAHLPASKFEEALERCKKNSELQEGE